jgi:hypothetical protein
VVICGLPTEQGQNMLIGASATASMHPDISKDLRPVPLIVCSWWLLCGNVGSGMVVWIRVVICGLPTEKGRNMLRGGCASASM